MRAGIGGQFIEQCVAAAVGNPMLGEIRERSSGAVLAVFRLVKTALVHAADNDAMVQSASKSREVLAAFAAELGMAVTITFVEDSVFVCGQLLRASREMYEAAMQLGQRFAAIGVTEVTVEAGVDDAQLLAFGVAVAVALRDASRRRAVLDAQIPHIRVRAVDATLQRREEDAHLPLEQRVLRAYAVGLMVLRNFFNSIAAGSTVMPQKLKRISQKLVVLAESGHPALLGLTALNNAHRDDAGRALQSAILMLAVGRQVTSDRMTLAQLVMTALMADIGRTRIAGPSGRNRTLELHESAARRVPAITGGMLLATGGVNASSALRTVVTVDTIWSEHRDLLGPPFRGLTRLPQAEVLELVRRLLDLRAPRSADMPLSPLEALAKLGADRRVDKGLFRLLVRALGLLPIGTVVEFETGEWGVVVAPSSNPALAHLPKIRLVTDRSGRALARVRQIDLGMPSAGRVYPRVHRVVDPAEAGFNPAAVFVAEADAA